jgi:hypothetical protein
MVAEKVGAGEGELGGEGGAREEVRHCRGLGRVVMGLPLLVLMGRKDEAEVEIFEVACEDASSVRMRSAR